MLCGEMFGLRVMRHRYFESSFPVVQPLHPRHDPRGAIRKQGDGGWYYRVYGHETGKAEWGKAMGIDWMRSPELAQAIPPAFARWVALQFMKWKGDEEMARRETIEQRIMEWFDNADQPRAELLLSLVTAKVRSRRVATTPVRKTKKRAEQAEDAIVDLEVEMGARPQ